MKKFSIIGLDTVKEDLISRLMDLGAAQINDAGARLQDEEMQSLGERDGDEEKAFSLDVPVADACADLAEQMNGVLAAE